MPISSRMPGVRHARSTSSTPSLLPANGPRKLQLLILRERFDVDDRTCDRQGLPPRSNNEAELRIVTLQGLEVVRCTQTRWGRQFVPAVEKQHEASVIS